jgi:MerR family transcriptional regulator, redox-sensitive transcriptional activator SoxR
MSGMSIGEVARRAGLNASAIRYYESTGLLPEPRRVRGRRCYDHEVLWRLDLIDAARASGFTIREIRTLLHGFPEATTARERWNSLASAKLGEVERQIERLERMRASLLTALACDCASLEECARLLPMTARVERDSSSLR